MVSVHGAVVLFNYCSADTQCTASVYFGLPTTEAALPLMTDSTPETTSNAILSGGLSLRDINDIMQVIGVYALLLGVIAIVILEVVELRFLKKLKGKKRRAH